jgi:type IV secretion system protein VirB2
LNMNAYRAGALCASALILCAYGTDLAAQDIDFTKAENAGNQVVAFMRGPLATIAFVIALAAAGFMAAMNRISWAWPGAVILGAVLVFGGPAFVDSLRSILS